MLFGETVAVYCKNRTEHINTLCGKKAEISNVERGGTSNDQNASWVEMISSCSNEFEHYAHGDKDLPKILATSNVEALRKLKILSMFELVFQLIAFPDGPRYMAGGKSGPTEVLVEGGGWEDVRTNTGSKSLSEEEREARSAQAGYRLHNIQAMEETADTDISGWGSLVRRYF
jgi:hypothetical protein